MKKIVLALMVVLLMGSGAGWHAQAQDGLSDEELALLDRVIEARKQFSTWTAYSEEVSGVNVSSFAMMLAENKNSRVEMMTWSRSASVIPGETENNVQAEVGAVYSYEETSTGKEPITTQYDISGELRLVDGVAYVQAAYQESTPDVPEVPDGWVTIRNDAENDQYPSFEGFQIDDLLEKDTLDEAVENLELLRTIASTVFLDTDTLEDGRPVDIITVQLEREGIAEFLGEDLGDNVISSALMETGNNSATLRFWLTADHTIYELDSVLHLEGIGLDGPTLSADLPEGVTLDITLEIGRYAIYVPQEEAGEPAVAPE
ncbi:MAG TPA: hypothetical protein VHP83_16350 [Aggregatilineaceae bacterium]|nr:hypothetical protein [Aggregatilineaceae bacterium]